MIRASPYLATMALNSALAWYQRKIGTYDKQLWEKTVEQRILKIDVFSKHLKQGNVKQPSKKGLGNVPKKITRLKTELIDVDLVRGSAFPKAKPQHGPLVAARRGLLRVLLLPLYFAWWRQQTSNRITLLLLFIYFSQMGILIIYFMYAPDSKDFMDLGPAEAFLPVLLMLILGVIHSQVVATVKTNGGNTCRSKIKRKRLKKRSVGKSTRPSPVERSSSRSTFPFAYYNSDDLEQTPRASASHCDIQPSNQRKVQSCGDQSTENEKGQLTKETRMPVHRGDEGEPNTQQILVNRDLQVKDEEDGEEGQSPETDNTSSPESSPHALGHRLTAMSVSGDKSDADPHNDSAVQDISSGDLETDQFPSDADEHHRDPTCKRNGMQNGCSESRRTILRRRASQFLRLSQESRLEYHCNSSGDSEADTTFPNTPIREHTSDGEWCITTNTEGENSYSSNSETEDDRPVAEDPFGWQLNGNLPGSVPATPCPNSDKVSCTIWEGRDVHKVNLSVLDISSSIIRRVDTTAVGTDYLLAGLGFAGCLALMPTLLRFHDAFFMQQQISNTNLSQESTFALNFMFSTCLGSSLNCRFMVLSAIFNSFCLSILFFFLLAVAERTFKQRFLYAKLFCHLTSSRRARKSDLPHFRLNKVRNIKTWLSVRSYLKRHGPQRSVDVIVSAAFILAFLVITFLCFQLMKDSENFGHALLHWELVLWTLALGLYLLRFMTLGAKINKKYRNPSVLITEQINLYLQMEQKPHKKEGLTLAHNVLKLAADLLKELESPFKISGLSANPYLYNITKLIILSAFSAVVKEMLGFKLKLHKIKMI